jgi:sulfur relay (sulfurtransferase) DsrC/TusE family protein
MRANGLPEPNRGENLDLENIFWKCLALLRSHFVPFIIMPAKKQLEMLVKGMGVGQRDTMKGLETIFDAFGFTWSYVSTGHFIFF